MEASRSLVSKLRGCVSFCKNLANSFVKPTPDLGLNPMVSPPASGRRVHVDTSQWRKVNSRSVGMTFSMIPESSRIVLTILRNEGYDAYLVGGCVRDMLRNKVPKDFDVITSANLQEIKKKFHRSYIVGRRFPICMVHVRGSAIEVSSFETVASHATEKEDIHLTEMPEGCDAKEFLLWRNSLKRDFTINSLFYDPFAQRIYDYSNGMTDLKAKKLRTLVPAHLSFEEDCARILRGIRIAARLRFSFAEDAEKAIHSLHASVTTLDKGRLMMELNYMLSYGAAEPSLILLKRFKVLELLLPFQAAYLAERSRPFTTQRPVMLMKLFFNLDRLTSCDQPCSSGLWVSLLAFHLTLVNNPQVAIVVWAFSSLLYHGNWKESVKAARKYSAGHVLFTPEILKSLDNVTDEELSQKVAKFASMILDSLDMLTDKESLCKAMSRCYPSFPTSSLACISMNSGKEVSAIFSVLMNDVESLREERVYYNIDYSLLGKGDIPETRFALGKIIMDTMRSGVIYSRTELATENKDGAKQGRSVLDDQKRQQKAKQQKLKKQEIKLEQKGVMEKMEETLSCPDRAQRKHQLKKVAVEDIKNLPSLQEACLKNAKVESKIFCEAQTSNLIHSVLGKVPSMTNRHEPQAPEEVLDVVGKVTAIRKRRMSQAPEKILSVIGKVSQPKIQPKEQLLMNMVNESSDVYQTKIDDRQEKLARLVDRPQPKVDKTEVENRTSSYTELETVKGKDGAKRGRSVLDDQKRQQKAKQPKLKKQGIDLEQKGVKENMKETLSCPDIAQKKQQLKKVVVKDVENLFSFQEACLKNAKVESEKLCEAQLSNQIHSVLGKGSQLKIQRNEQLPTNRVDDTYQPKKDEKQARLVDGPQDESLTTKRARKLSSIFK